VLEPLQIVERRGLHPLRPLARPLRLILPNQRAASMAACEAISGGAAIMRTNIEHFALAVKDFLMSRTLTHLLWPSAERAG
jgi:hypothetical protein